MSEIGSFATPEVKCVFFSREIQNEDVGITIRILVETCGKSFGVFSLRIQTHSNRTGLMIPILSAEYDPMCNPIGCAWILRVISFELHLVQLCSCHRRSYTSIITSTCRKERLWPK